MTIGSLMIDVEGTSLTAEDIDILQHPLTGGVILFKRNFINQPQIAELCLSIRKNAAKPILIAVDQEGGRVQRFNQEFTKLPAMGSFRSLKLTEQEILDKLTATAWLMASELLASGIDISFAPILDIDSGISEVIGDRAFSDNPQQIIDYSSAFIEGMSAAGMAATGKHFPGHGSTMADSHIELPIDPRSMQQIRDNDLAIFVALCQRGLSAIMPAHVIYPEADELPACFSPYWLKTILRNEINFTGTIFSDDLSMAGAKSLGDIISRAKQALAAGCDMILCCNDRDATILLLDKLAQTKNNEVKHRIEQMMQKASQYNFNQLSKLAKWQNINKMLSLLESQLENQTE